MKQKIDFFEELYLMGIQIMVPEQVVKELKKLKKSSALTLLEKEEGKFKEISLKGTIVDNSIINYAMENPTIIIATLDKDIQNKIRNRKMIIRGKKKLEII
jgi:rRNA-processing protein FCF1